MSNPAPAGQYQVNLTLGYELQGWNERYIINNTDFGTCQLIATRLCYLRSFWMGQNVFIDKATVSDLKGLRIGIPVMGCPIGSPYPSNSSSPLYVGRPHDNVAGFQFRLQCTNTSGGITWFENRLLRGVPDNWITGEHSAIPVPVGALVGSPQPGYKTLASYKDWTLLQLAPGGLGLNALLTNYVGANWFLSYLVHQTCYVQFPRKVTQKPNQSWDYIYLQKIGVRRSGKRYKEPVGRFSR